MKREISIAVRSKRVPSRIETMNVNTIHPTFGTISVRGTRSAVLYDYVLDASQTRALGEAKELAAITGACLKIRDLARERGLRGTFRRIFRRGETTPLLKLAGVELGPLLETDSRPVVPSTPIIRS